MGVCLVILSTCPLLPPDCVLIGGTTNCSYSSKPGLPSDCLRQLLIVNRPQQNEVLSMRHWCQRTSTAKFCAIKPNQAQTGHTWLCKQLLLVLHSTMSCSAQPSQPCLSGSSQEADISFCIQAMHRFLVSQTAGTSCRSKNPARLR